MSDQKLTLIDLEKHFSEAIDAMRGEVDVERITRYLLGMLFLKRFSDVFDESRNQVIQEQYQLGKSLIDAELAAEDKKWYKNVFYVPACSRWCHLSNCKGPLSLALIKAIGGLESNNNLLVDGLIYIKPDFMSSQSPANKQLKYLIEHFAAVNLGDLNLSDPSVIGELSQSLIGRFAFEAGRREGAFFTPSSLAKLLANLIKPQAGHAIYDPCCGSGGVLLATKNYISERPNSDAVTKYYGQEQSNEIYSLALIHMVLNGVRHADIKSGNVLESPAHFRNKKLMQFDRVVSSPPFSAVYDRSGMEKSIGDQSSRRFAYGVTKKADLMFFQHMIAMCSEKGKVVTILAHGALFRGGEEQKIREGLILDDLVEAVISLPVGLFYGTGISAAIIVACKSKVACRKDRVLFVDARYDYGKEKSHNVLRKQDIIKISNTYDDFSNNGYYSKLVTNEDIRGNEFNLNVSQYIDNSPTFKRIVELNKHYHIFDRYKLYDEEGDTALSTSIKPVGSSSNPENSIFISRQPSKEEVLLKLVKSETNKKFKLDFFEVCLNEELILCEYAKLYFESELGRLVLSHLPQSPTMPMLSISDLSTLEIPVPSLGDQKNIIKLAQKLDSAAKHLVDLKKELTSNPSLIREVEESTDNFIYQISSVNNEALVKHLLSLNETKHIEFKQFFFLSHQQVYQEGGKVKVSEEEQSKVVKNIASFLNSEGGTLLLGVEDDATVVGVDKELNKLKIKKLEQYFKRIERKVVNQLGEKISKLLEFSSVLEGENTIVVIKCDKSPVPVFQVKREFYIRRTAESEAIFGNEMLDYIKMHF